MSDENIKPIEDLAAQGAEQPQPEAPAATEAAPSGGDGSQGLEMPTSSDASEAKGEGAQAVDEIKASVDESAGEGAASPEPSEAPAAPLAEPTAEKLPEEQSAATTTETDEAAKPAADMLGSEGADTEPAAAAEEAKGDDKSSGEPLDQGPEAPVAEAASTDEVKADKPKTVEQVTATGVADVQPIFGGASNPSPAPDLQGQEELPHPALEGHGRGFISGTTQSTQSALPVPGDAMAALVAADAIDKAQGVPSLPQAEDAAASDDQKDHVDADAGTAAAKPALDAPASDDAPSSDTPAVPTAAHAPEAFIELNSDGSAALDDIDEGEAEVLRLELRGLANLALALIKRLDKISEKKAVSGHLESIQSTAQQVVAQSLNIFEVEEDELSGFESVSSDIILDDLY